MSKNIIQSVGGVVYYWDQKEPRFLLLKKLAHSHQIERVVPKGKVQGWESIQDTVRKEVSEEAGVPINQIKLQGVLGETKSRNTERGYSNKDINYYLVEYTGDPDAVYLDSREGYLWVYKRANLQEVLSLVYYPNIRETIRTAYKKLQNKTQKDAIKQEFMKRID